MYFPLAVLRSITRHSREEGGNLSTTSLCCCFNFSLLCGYFSFSPVPQSSTIGETPKKRQFLRRGVKKNRLEIFKGFRRTSFLSHAPCRCGLRRNGQMREISFGRGRRRCRRCRKNFGQPERFAGLLATAAFRQSPPLPLFAFFLHILFHLIFGSPITTSDLFPKTTCKFFIRMLFTLGQIIRLSLINI